MRRLAMITACLLAMPAMAFAQQSQPLDTEWKRRFDAAGDHVFGCYGEKKDEHCVALIDGFRSAMNAPDADNAVKHELFKQLINAQWSYGRTVRERGDTAGALKILLPAYDEVVAHYDNGRHFHTYIDNLRLQQDIILTYVALNQHATAEPYLATARAAADQLDAAEVTDRSRDLHATGRVRSEELESQLAELYAQQAADAAEDSKTAEAQAGYGRAIAAYARAEHWLRQSDELGVTAFAGGSASLRLARHKLALSKAQFGRGDAAAANQSLLIAGAYSCGAVGENFVARFNAREPTGPEEWLSYEVCNDVTAAYYVASGQAEKDSMAWYNEQLEILNTDISPELMRAMTEAQAARPR